MPDTKPLTGYPSVDKPWLKYYSEEAVNAKMPECSAYEYIRQINKSRMDKAALNYFGKKTTYREMFRRIDECARALNACGVKRGEIISVSLPNIPEAVYLFYAISKLGAVANMIDPRVSSEGIADPRMIFIINFYTTSPALLSQQEVYGKHFLSELRWS